MRNMLLMLLLLPMLLLVLLPLPLWKERFFLLDISIVGRNRCIRFVAHYGLIRLLEMNEVNETNKRGGGHSGEGTFQLPTSQNTI